MMISRSSKRNIALFVTAFLLCGILHVLLWRVDFTLTFSQLFMSVLTLLWALAIQKRVADARLRRLLLAVAAHLILFYVLQIMRYQLFDGIMTAERYLWYAYYIPFMGIALLCLYIALCIHRPQEKPLPAISRLLAAVPALLTLGILTNDLHFLMFRFPSGIMSDEAGKQNGPLFYLFAFGFSALLAISFWIILRKSRRYTERAYRALPALPLLMGTAYFILYPLEIGPRLLGARLWNIGEMFGFCMIAFLEACIVVGMIPANRSYERLFSPPAFPPSFWTATGRWYTRPPGRSTLSRRTTMQRSCGMPFPAAAPHGWWI